MAQGPRPETLFSASKEIFSKMPYRPFVKKKIGVSDLSSGSPDIETNRKNGILTSFL